MRIKQRVESTQNKKPSRIVLHVTRSESLNDSIHRQQRERIHTEESALFCFFSKARCKVFRSNCIDCSFLSARGSWYCCFDTPFAVETAMTNSSIRTKHKHTTHTIEKQQNPSI